MILKGISILFLIALSSPAFANWDAKTFLKKDCAVQAMKIASATSLKRLLSQSTTSYSTEVRSMVDLSSQLSTTLTKIYEVTLETSAGFPADDEAYKVTLDSKCNLIGLEITDEL